MFLCTIAAFIAIMVFTSVNRGQMIETSLTSLYPVCPVIWGGHDWLLWIPSLFLRNSMNYVFF
jgi:hypothetical protein